MSAETFGPYRIEELLGRGGMGQVHKAYDTVHERTVALKRLTEMYAADEAYRARFRRESQIVARLREPHVIPIHGFGEIDGRLYLDMRLVEGTDLKAVMRSGALPPKRAVRLLGQVAGALDAAHADGLVHRDVKPSNVLVTPGDFVYLVDFGIARGMGSDVTSITMSGDVVGTLDYMAPERFGDEPVDGRVDVYALACVLYACLTGRRPFLATDPAGQVRAQLQEFPPPPSTLNKSLPRAIDDVVLRGMAKEPDQRFQTAGAMAAAAEAALSGGTSTRAATTGWAPGPGRPQPGPQTPPQTRMMVGVPTPTGFYPGPPTAYQPGPPSAPNPAYPPPTGYPAPTGIGPAPGMPPQQPPSRRGIWLATAALVLVIVVVASVLIVELQNRKTDNTAGPGPTTSAHPSATTTTTKTKRTTTTTRPPNSTQQSETSGNQGSSGAVQKLFAGMPAVYRGNSSCKEDEDTENSDDMGIIQAAIQCTSPNDSDPSGIQPPDGAEFAQFADQADLEASWQSLVEQNDLTRDDDLGGCKPTEQPNTYGLYYRSETSSPKEYQTCFVTKGSGEVWWMDLQHLYIGALISGEDNSAQSLERLDDWWDDMILTPGD